MPNAVRASWFGRELSVMLSNGKSLSGELTEVTEHYIVLKSKNVETQVMVHAILIIRPGAPTPKGQ